MCGAWKGHLFFSHQGIDSFLHLDSWREQDGSLQSYNIFENHTKIIQKSSKNSPEHKKVTYIYKFWNLKLNKWMHIGNDVARVLARATQQDFYRKSVIFIWCQHQKLGIIKLIWKTQPANHMYNVCTMLHSILVCTLHISVGHYTDIWLVVYYVSIIKNFSFHFNWLLDD